MSTIFIAATDMGKFGRLTVIEDRGIRIPKGPRYVFCRCDCGTEREFQFRHLKGGQAKSCGCLHKEIVGKAATKHGDHKHPLYRIWVGMRQRCKNPKSCNYPYYGGRGITVCDLWTDSFERFRTWAAVSGWKHGLTLERIDNNSGYSPVNCRWATRLEQARNTRRTVKLEVNGKTMSGSEVADMCGINRETFLGRIRRGYSLERAMIP